MESKGCDEVLFSGSDNTTCPEATVEIKIKTLDSQTYILRVDKCVPVPALKEKIATLTGVLSEEQRLICRGKVLKDDQLLSAYHVEDGHTLHLVVRQPVHPSLDNFVDDSGNDPASISGHRVNQSGLSVVFETFNIAESGDGVSPDLNRIISAVLGSFGATNIGNSSEGADLSDVASEVSLRSTIGGLGDHGQQTEQIAGQSNPETGGGASASPLDHLQLPVIPDSLATLSQYLTRMRNEFHANVTDSVSSSHGVESFMGHGQDDGAASSTSGGLPTPASLADILLCTRQLLMNQSAESLSQLARQLVDQRNVSDDTVRMATQSSAMRSGVLMQRLGALLLELGRTTTALRMGQTATEAVMNAGPAVFISTSGPNPIMVQPLQFQTGPSFGAIPTGTGQTGSGLFEGSVGSGFVPRNIDIRISSGPLTTSSTPTATRPHGQRNLSSPEIPLSTSDAAVLPASGRRVSSNTARVSMGLLYPVTARIRRVSRARGARNSTSTVSQDSPGPVREDANVSAGEGAQNVQGSSQGISSGLDQLLRSVFPDEHTHTSDVTSATNDSRTNQGATPQESAEIIEGGDLFSHLLQQVMPILSENLEGGSAAGREDVVENRDMQTSSTQGHENIARGTRSRRHGNPPSPPSSKRQRP